MKVNVRQTRERHINNVSFVYEIIRCTSLFPGELELQNINITDYDLVTYDVSSSECTSNS